MPSDLTAILKLHVPVIVQVGCRSMRVGEVMNLSPGAIIELPKGVDEELDLLVANKQIGTGKAVKVGENFGLRVMYVGDLAQRVEAMGMTVETPPPAEVSFVRPPSPDGEGGAEGAKAESATAAPTPEAPAAPAKAEAA